MPVYLAGGLHPGNVARAIDMDISISGALYLVGTLYVTVFGNVPLNSLSSGTYFNLDTSVTKRFPIGERVSFEIKTTFINILNRANFTYGNDSFDSTSFGRITGTSGSQRVIHFQGSLKF